MTERIYENDSYIREFEAVITSVELLDEDKGLWEVVLDRTAFFPEGGGQNADTGWLDDGKVLDVQLRGAVVYHKTTLKASVGQRVLGRLDWDKRFSNMQQHSGEHIFSGLTHRHYGYNNVGFHLGSQVVTMDFDGVLEAGDIARLEKEVNEVIVSNAAVTVSYPTDQQLEAMEYRSKIAIDGQVRLVTIEGCDVCACCAPHVAKTGEIGLLKVVDFQRYKGGTRVSILCGFRALADYEGRRQVLLDISHSLSAPWDKTGEAVKRQQQEQERLRQVIYGLQSQLIQKEIQEIPEGSHCVWHFKEELEAPVMRRIVNESLERVTGLAGIFCGNDADGYKYIIGAKTGDARAAAGLLKESFAARGGGSAQMVQGYVSAGKGEIEAVLDLI